WCQHYYRCRHRTPSTSFSLLIYCFLEVVNAGDNAGTRAAVLIIVFRQRVNRAVTCPGLYPANARACPYTGTFPRIGSACNGRIVALARRLDAWPIAYG